MASVLRRPSVYLIQCINLEYWTMYRIWLPTIIEVWYIDQWKNTVHITASTRTSGTKFWSRTKQWYVNMH